jgi:hypothetical protein
MHWLSRYWSYFTRAVFMFVAAGAKKISFCFPQKKIAGTSPPSKHLGLFLWELKPQFFAPFAMNGNTTSVKIDPIVR